MKRTLLAGIAMGLLPVAGASLAACSPSSLAPPPDPTEMFKTLYTRPVDGGADPAGNERLMTAAADCKKALDSDFHDIRSKQNTQLGLTVGSGALGLGGGVMGAASVPAAGSDRELAGIGTAGFAVAAATLALISQQYSADDTSRAYGSRLQLLRRAVQLHAQLEVDGGVGDDYKRQFYSIAEALDGCAVGEATKSQK